MANMLGPKLFGATKMDQSSVATFKMEKYQSHMDSMKRLHWEFFSPPFYTSPGGHKMKVIVGVIENFLSIELGLKRKKL